MKLYLSSYKLGDKIDTLKEFFSTNSKVGYIPNALDFSKVDVQKRKEHIDADIQSLCDIGLEAALLDLRDYFGKKEELEKTLSGLGGVWVSGGNVFVLRQAMKLSALDDILQTLKQRNDFVYGGYSAAGCVLSDRLEAFQIVDDATDTPYEELKEVIWEGIGLIPYAFLPHYESDHSESADINKEVQYCVEHHIPFKTLRDGEVLIIDNG